MHMSRSLAGASTLCSRETFAGAGHSSMIVLPDCSSKMTRHPSFEPARVSFRYAYVSIAGGGVYAMLARDICGCGTFLHDCTSGSLVEDHTSPFLRTHQSLLPLCICLDRWRGR